MRRTGVACLKARPKTVNTEVGSNRFLAPATAEKMKEMTAVPPYPGKRAIHNWRFFIKPGKAATGPPVGQEFSKIGLKPMDFCKAFNDKTKPVFKDDLDLICRVQVYHDNSYSWRIETPPTAWFILRAVQKKRRETGPVKDKERWAGFITLEMCYEIAKYKEWNWARPGYPPIEVRARSVAGQARRMGIAVIGVDTPNSPVKGVSASQYEKQSAKYREEQWGQWLALKKEEAKNAPLAERLHDLEYAKLTDEELKALAADPSLLRDLYTATSPRSRNKFVDEKQRKTALERLRENANAPRFDDAETALRYTSEWRMPAPDQTEVDDTPFWNRDAMRTGQPVGGAP
uniref:Ribosomal protein L11 n=1 Tax=Neobodo designis TaxID=312471 RepID=A0A7S1QB30_NEODS|mmetsp:Transcript_39750/g.122888  ORF Transcript_39750/g.122888 Transcript_39750/m.122888 type:complete len:345 (+) Transcript_39750:66-1100(+)